MEIFYSQVLNIFTTRELAFFTWFMIFLIVCFFIKELRSSILNLLKCVFAPFFIIIILSLLAYMAVTTMILSKFDLWNFSLLKDTLFWFIFSGLGLCLKHTADKNFTERIKNIFKDNFKIVVILEFVMSSYTFNYWIEFIIFLVIFMIIVMNVFTDKKEEYKSVKSLTDGLLFIIGFVVLLLFIYFIKVHFVEIFSMGSARKILLPIFYTSFFILPAYLIKTYAEYEGAFIRLLINKNYDKKMTNFLKAEVFSVCKLNFKRLNNLVVAFNLLVEIPKTEDEFNNFVRTFLEREQIIPFSSNCIGFNPLEAQFYLSEEDLEINDYTYCDYDDGFGDYYGSRLKTFELADTLNYTLEGNNQEVKRIRLTFGEFLPKGYKSKNYDYFIKCTENLYLKALQCEMPQKLLLTLRKRNVTRHSIENYFVLFNKEILNNNLTHYEFSILIKK